MASKKTSSPSAVMLSWQFFSEMEIFHEGNVWVECPWELSGVGVGITMQDYKCLHMAVVIWATQTGVEQLCTIGSVGL